MSSRVASTTTTGTATTGTTTTGTAIPGSMLEADVANGEAPMHAPVRVLVAVDESETSLRAATCAHDFFGDEASYYVVNVGTSERTLIGGDPMTWGVAYPLSLAYVGRLDPAVDAGVDPGMPTGAERAQAEALQVSDAAHLPVGSVAVGVTGDPAEQIRMISEDEDIDVIVVGWSGGGWWRHLLEPSVAKAVIRTSDRPVLVVP